jgi:hypothetical protein
MALVPLTGQSRNGTPRAVASAARRSVSACEMVLICTSGWPERAPARMPSAPSTAASTVASEGRSVHTRAEVPATAAGDAAGSPPSASSPRIFSGSTS